MRKQHQVMISDKTKIKRQYRAQPISTFFGATFLPLRDWLYKIYLQWKSSKFQLNRFSKTNLMQTNLLLFFHHGAQGKPKDNNAPLIMIIWLHLNMIVQMIVKWLTVLLTSIKIFMKSSHDDTPVPGTRRPRLPDLNPFFTPDVILSVATMRSLYRQENSKPRVYPLLAWRLGEATCRGSPPPLAEVHRRRSDHWRLIKTTPPRARG